MIRLTDDELIELFDKQLPDLLERRPELEPRIYHAFMKFFATKEEVAVVLAELRDFRGEVEQRFDRVEQRIDAVEEQAQNFRAEVQERFTNLEERMEAGFQRLSFQDQKLEERMESGFREVNQAIDQLRAQDQRLEERMESGFQRLSFQNQRLEERMEAGFREMQHTIDRLGSRWGIRNESIFRQTMAELLEKSFGFHVEERTIQGEQFDCVISDGQHILVEISASVGPNIKDRLERKRRLYTEATGVEPARVILVTAVIHSRRAQSLREAGFDVIEPEEDTLVG